MPAAPSHVPTSIFVSLWQLQCPLRTIETCQKQMHRQSVLLICWQQQMCDELVLRRG